MSTFEVRDFDTDVLQASMEQPVLVDFWAPWCGPCRVIGPILEKLANEAANTAQARGEAAAWSLVKIDSDRHPELAQRYRVQGIPSMKLFYQGAVIAELTGALPEPDMRRWLQDNLPSEAKEALWEGIALMKEERVAEALPLLQKADKAGLEEAKVWLAEACVWDDPQAARDLLEHAGLSDRENALREVAAALLDEPLRGPESPAREPYAAGVEALRHRDYSASLEHLIRSITLQKSYREEAARRLVVAIFTLLGPSHPITVAQRRAFSMALY
jgi:putative thioredoxin